MNILVTGGAGYVGSHTARLLSAHGHEVYAYDDLSAGDPLAVAPGRLIVGSLTDTARLVEVLLTQAIDVVVHVAGLAQVGDSFREPDRYYETNVAGTLNLLQQMRRLGVGRIVFSSSCAIYGVVGGLPVGEDEAQHPVSPYGRTKLAAESAVLDYAAAHGWGVAVLRYFNAAGSGASSQQGRLIPKAVLAALGLAGPLEVFGTTHPTHDGTCIRDYVHVEDLAEAHLLALAALAPGRPLILNLGSGRGHSVLEVVRAVEVISGRKVPLQLAPAREGDPPALVADPTRAWSVLGWWARRSGLAGIVGSSWAWHLSPSSSAHADAEDHSC